MASYFTGIIGDPGSGKTSLMTALLHRAYLRGVPIIANYKLEFEATLAPFTALVNLPASMRGATIGIDELGEGADSYDFFASGPRKINKLVMQGRKLEFTIIYTVQRFGWIAKRLRQLTGGFILMDDLDGQKLGHTIENCDSLFKATFLNRDRAITRVLHFDGKPFQHLYNTRELIWGFDGERIDEDDE